jgi:glycosyltransferase involved in cell wall biosynthesis
MSKARIVLSINSAWNFVNFRRGLIRGLQANGFEIVALAPDDAHSDALRALGCRLVPLPMEGRGKSPLADAWLIARYWWILRRERPAAFLGYTIKPNIYGALAAHSLGIPVISNVAGLGTAFLDGGWLNRLVKLLYRVALRKARTVFFQNGEDLQLFRSLRIVKPEQAVLLPGSGVDIEDFSPVARPASGPGFVFLFSGRLLWSKGIREYVEAARRIREARSGAIFRILGIFDEAHPDGVPRAALDLWASSGIVEYLGAADDVRPFIAAADCVVLPTFYPEGTPRALLEAAAMGKPLIATDMPGCRDVIDDGRNGYLCAPRDAEDLEAKMEKMLALPPEARAAMGRESRRKAVDRFDEAIVVARYLEAIGRLIPIPARSIPRE